MYNRPYVYFKDGDAVVVDAHGRQIEGVVSLAIRASPRRAVVNGVKAICRPTDRPGVYAFAADKNGDLLTEDFSLDDVYLGVPANV